MAEVEPGLLSDLIVKICGTLFAFLLAVCIKTWYLKDRYVLVTPLIMELYVGCYS